MTDGGTDDAPATTGDPRVDVALTQLQDLDGLDLAAQLDIFTHLQAALALVLDSPEPVDEETTHEVGDGTPRPPAG